MKKFIIFAVCICLHFGTSFAGEIEFPHITVFGTATTKVTPNTMTWYLTVKNEGGNLQNVASQHNKIIGNILALLNSKKVSSDEIQTARMEFGENWEFKNQSRIKEGYFASTNILFRIEDLKKYIPLWIGLSRINSVSIDRIYYDHSNRTEYQNETRKNALLVAKEKAITLAKTVGSQIGEPLLIEEVINEQRNYALLNFSSTERNGTKNIGSIAPGKIPIRIRIKVAFRLITHDK